VLSGRRRRCLDPGSCAGTTPSGNRDAYSDDGAVHAGAITVEQGHVLPGIHQDPADHRRLVFHELGAARRSSQGESPALGVLAGRMAAMPIGIAYLVGLVEHRRGPAQTFRLVVGKLELPRRFLCVGRKFIPRGEAAEEL